MGKGLAASSMSLSFAPISLTSSKEALAGDTCGTGEAADVKVAPHCAERPAAKRMQALVHTMITILFGTHSGQLECIRVQEKRPAETFSDPVAPKLALPMHTSCRSVETPPRAWQRRRTLNAPGRPVAAAADATLGAHTGACKLYFRNASDLTGNMSSNSSKSQMA